MKRITAIIFCIIVFSVSIVPFSVFADSVPATVVDYSDLPPSVVDEADILTETQMQELTDKLNDLRSTYHMDVSVVVVESIGSSSTSDMMDYADDYFDYNGYGCGADDDGIMFVISMNDRMYHFTTHARGINVFNDNARIYLEDEMISDLESGNYYDAFVTFANCTEEILVMEVNGETFGATPAQKKKGLVVVFAVPLLIAAFMTYRQYKNMNDAVQRAEADDYARGNVDLRVSKDIFLYSTVHKTPIANNDSNGGSSTHRSSSGRTHGGGGGRF